MIFTIYFMCDDLPLAVVRHCLLRAKAATTIGWNVGFALPCFMLKYHWLNNWNRWQIPDTELWNCFFGGLCQCYLWPVGDWFVNAHWKRRSARHFGQVLHMCVYSWFLRIVSKSLDITDVRKATFAETFALNVCWNTFSKSKWAPCG